MKTIIFALIAFWTANYLAGAQSQYEKAVQDAKKLLIEGIPGSIMLQQSSNSSLRIETDRQIPPVEDERAKGLKPVASNIDNTGIGLALFQSGSSITISGSSPFENDHHHYTIFVPVKLDVAVNFTSPFSGNEVEISGLSNPVEVKTLSANIAFTNITGPAVLHSISGNIEGVFDKFNQEAPSSITSVSGLIDVAFPPATGANVSLKSISGKIYSGFDIKREEKSENKDKRALGMSQIGGIGQQTEGLINGGGVKLSIQSISGNIYIREK